MPVDAPERCIRPDRVATALPGGQHWSMSDPTPDPKSCPLCGKPNGCRAGDPDCWCHHETVPAPLQALVPTALVRKACICRSCVQAWKRDAEAFRAGLAERP